MMILSDDGPGGNRHVTTHSHEEDLETNMERKNKTPKPLLRGALSKVVRSGFGKSIP